MKKCCFIIPYFGRFPDTFPIFLKSCRENPDFDWLLLTNDDRPFAYPENVHPERCTLAEFLTLAEERLGFPVRVDEPHKLCDFKPAYGFLLEDRLQDYRFWGYCDLDTVMGKLGSLLTEELLENYDKLFCLGHMTIFRNTPENNRVFMAEHNGRLLYREVFTSAETVWFDEEYHDDNNVNRIFLAQGKRVYQKDLSLNMSITCRPFRRTEYVGSGGDEHGYRFDDHPGAAYFWDRGRLLRLEAGSGGVVTQEFLYMHLQYRNMTFTPSAEAAEVMQIVPNRYLAAKRVPDTVTGLRLAKLTGPDMARIRRVLGRLLRSRGSK